MATSKSETRRKAARRKPTKAAKAKVEREAAEAKERATAAKAKGRRLDAAKTQLRNALIVARDHQGWTQPAIAAEAGIAERQVRVVLKQAAELPSPLEMDPMRVLVELVQGWRLDIASFQAIASAHGDNPGVAVSAMKGAMSARQYYAELMLAVGKLPENLETFRSQAAIKRIADEMVKVMARVAKGEMKPEDAQEYFIDLVVGEEREAPDGAGAPT